MHPFTKFGIHTSNNIGYNQATQKYYASLRHPKMHPHTKFGLATSQNLEDMHRTQNRTDGWTLRIDQKQDQGHSDLKMVRDTPPFQDTSTHLSWDPYLEEYRRYALDMKRAGRWMEGPTLPTDSVINYYMPPKISSKDGTVHLGKYDQIF